MRWAALTTKTKATIVVAVAAAIWVGGVGSAGALVGAAAHAGAGQPAALVATADRAAPTETPTSMPTPTPTPVIVVSEETVDSAIAFERTTVDDPSLAKGQQRITTAGVPGVLTTTWKVTTTDGVETDRVAVHKEITRAAVTEVTAVGSYVAPPAPVEQAPAAPAPAPAPAEQAPAQGLITPGAFCADAQNGTVGQAANGRSYRCGGKGPDGNGHLHWNTM